MTAPVIRLRQRARCPLWHCAGKPLDRRGHCHACRTTWTPIPNNFRALVQAAADQHPTATDPGAMTLFEPQTARARGTDRKASS